jgi:hypothetical protein
LPLSRRGTDIIQVQLIEYSVIAARISSDRVRRLTFGVTVTARGRTAGIVPRCNPTGLKDSYNYVAAEPS